MATCLVLLITSIVASGQASATTAAARRAALETKVRHLIRQLDDDRPAARQAAEDQLYELGPNILALLPSKQEPLSAETRHRLERLRQKLEVALAEQIVQPTRVQLSGKMTGRAALAAIAKQTGNKLLGDEQFGADKPIELAFNKTLFWRAFDTVLDKMHATVDLYGGQADTLMLQPAPPSETPRTAHACYAGPFRFEATEISLVRNLRAPQASGMQIRLEVLWEPRLHPITLTQKMTAVTMTDDHDRTVTARNPATSVSAIAEPTVTGVELILPMSLPRRTAQSLASVRGQLAVLLPGREETFEFHNVRTARNVHQRKAGVVVVFEGLQKNADVTELRIRVRFDNAANALQSHLGWIYRNEAYLRTSDGTRLDQAGVQLVGKQANEVSLAYLFSLEKPAQQYTFVYKTPTMIVEKKIPYELKQVPLP